jgi:hypothetical protein
VFASLATAQITSTSTTTTTSYGDNIKNAIVGFFIGWLLFFFAFPLIAFNEGLCVHREKVLDFAKRLLKEHKDKAKSIDVEREDTRLLDKHDLVHMTGLVKPSDLQLADPDFNVVVANANRLRRRVEMYQVYEESKTSRQKDTIGGGSTETTTYTIAHKWSNTPLTEPIHNQCIEHNPPFPVQSAVLEPRKCMIREDESFDAEDGNLENWGFLSDSQKDRLDCTLVAGPVEIPALTLQQLRPHQGVGATTHFFGNGTLLNPQVGDVKIDWYYAGEDTYSLIAKKTGDQFSEYEVQSIPPFSLPSCCLAICCCVAPCISALNDTSEFSRRIDLFEKGRFHFNEMLEHAHKSNALRTNLLRLVSFVLMVFGICLILDPIPTVLDFIGPIGSFVRVGTFLVAFVVGFVFWTLAVALSWLVYHPLKAFLILLAGGLITTGIYFAVHASQTPH